MEAIQTLYEKRLVRYPLFALFGFFIFLLAFIVTFPGDQVKEIISVQVEQALDHKYRVTIGSLRPSLIPGLVLRDVTIEERAPERPAPIEGADVPEVEDMTFRLSLNRVSIRVAPLASIFGPAVKFKADTGGGNIRGMYRHSSPREVVIHLDDIDLRRTHAVSSLLGLPVFGTLVGKIDLRLDPRTGRLIGGDVALNGRQLTVGPANVRTDRFPPLTYLEIPQTNFGTLVMALDIDQEDARTRVKIDKFTIGGRDIRAESWGHLDLGAQRASSNANVNLRMQLDETFVRENNLTSMLSVNEVRSGKYREWYGFTVRGRMDRIQFRGNPQAARGPQEETPPAEED